MEKTRKIMVFGALVAFVLLVAGLVMAVNITQKGAYSNGKGCKQGGWNKHLPPGNLTLMDNLGLSENASREQVRDALWEKSLKDLGLTEDSTLKEYKQAIDAKMKTLQSERAANMTEKLSNIKEKLGLSENSTKDEVTTAMNKWREENKNTTLGEGHGYGRHGFGGLPGDGLPPISPGFEGRMGMGRGGCNKTIVTP